MRLLKALVNDLGNADVPIINRGRSTRAKGPAKKVGFHAEVEEATNGPHRRTGGVEPSGKDDRRWKERRSWGILI